MRAAWFGGFSRSKGLELNINACPAYSVRQPETASTCISIRFSHGASKHRETFSVAEADATRVVRLSMESMAMGKIWYRQDEVFEPREHFNFVSDIDFMVLKSLALTRFGS